MAITPNTIYDTFARSVSSGWGFADSGAAWKATSNTNLSVSGGAARYKVLANSATRIIRADLTTTSAPIQSTDEVLMRVSWTGSGAWPLTNWGPALSISADHQNYYYASLQGNYNEISIGCSVDGYRWELNRTSASGLEKGVDYWVRFKRNNSLFLKVWRVGSTEPASWSLTSGLWDGSKPIGSGSPGVYVRGTRDAHDIQIKDMVYYTLEDTQNTSEILDHFNRASGDSWGVSQSKHVWEGAVANDPQATALLSVGSTQTVDGGRGKLEITNSERIALAGGSRTGNVESEAKFLIGGVSGGAGIYRLGIRGTRGYRGGHFTATGYMLQVTAGTNDIHIYKRTSASSSNYTWVASGKASEVIQINKIYRARIQAKGSAIKASVWDNNAAEPVWQISTTDSSISSGTGWIGGQATVAAGGAHYTYQYEYGVPRADAVAPGIPDPPPPPPNNFVTTGSISVVAGSVTDTSARIRATYTHDVDNNATVTISWKRAIAGATWSTVVSSPTHNRSTKTYEATISGLIKGAEYDIRATYSDSSGVKGVNPLTTKFQTTRLGVEAGTATVVNIRPDQATIEAGYNFDLDNTSTAVLSSRKSSQSTYLIEDFFVDAQDAVPLRNYDSTRGGEWVRHSTSSQGVDSLFFRNGYYINSATSADKVLYTHTNVSETSEVIASANIYINSLSNSIGVAARVNTTQETYYGAGIDHTTQSWELFKVTNGVKVVLESTPFEGNTNVIYSVELRVTDLNKSVFLNNKLIMSSTDNTITSGRVGYYATGVTAGTSTNQITMRSFFAYYRSATGDWVSHGNMAPNRATKKFRGIALGLSPDTVYEFRVTFSDSSPYGANTGKNPALVIGTTPGRAAFLNIVGASTLQTSATISAFVLYDTNRNSTLSFQYKAVTESVWNTVSFQKVAKNRETGRFDLIVAGLIPSTTYEVKVAIDDPDGLIEGSPSILNGLFTTKGFVTIGSAPEKYYIWKIYDRKGKYINTIHDAPLPNFNMHENGGTTDQELVLHRSFSEMSLTKIIDFQHRIDIWAIDPKSNGMGPNLITDPEIDSGGWVVGQTSGTFGRNSSIDPKGGPDGGSAIKIVAPDAKEWPQASNPIHVDEEVPIRVSCAARTIGANLRLYVRAYNNKDQGFHVSDDQAETIGPDWQKISVDYIPPVGTEYIRVIVENDNKGTMWADKFEVRAKEMKVYSGNIESFTPKIDRNGETVSIQVLGLASFLSDDYIEFLQFVDNQPVTDIQEGRTNHGATDPSEMMKMIIDMASRQNPRFNLYYTSESIKSTGTLMQYTFRDVQIRHAFDKIRDICPAGWHYFIGADGLVTLRGPQHAPTHYLRIGVEISDFEVEKSIRNLKNYVRVKGRQDSDKSEPGSEGTISYVAFDQPSIDKFGKRMTVISDSQIIDSETARLVGDGRLEEYNKEEQRVQCTVPDEKYLSNPTGALRGYNIEAFQPGDNVIIVDPLSGPRYSYWNQMIWNENSWDINDVFHPVPEGVPIKTVRYQADQVELELSERPPSQVGDYAKLYKWIALKDKE